MKGIKGIFLKIFIAILIIILVIAGYFLYREIKVYRDGSNEYELIEQTFAKDEKDTPQNRKIDFGALKQTNPEVVGWIYIPGTVVDYPVVQADNNSKYLNRTFYGKRNKAGAIFVDSRNKPDFTDDNTILYGHNMNNKSMFHMLLKYAKQDFYDNHKIIYYYTEDGVFEMRVFTAFTTKPVDSFTNINFSAKEDNLKTLAKRAVIQSDEHIDGDENIISLSTCAYGFKDARFVVQATVNKIILSD